MAAAIARHGPDNVNFRDARLLRRSLQYYYHRVRNLRTYVSGGEREVVC